MDDDALARALERGELPNEGFHHVDHLRVGLVYLREAATVGDAIDRLGSTLRRFAASVGQPGKYSRATTEFWMYQLASARALMPDAASDALLRACPQFLDRHFMQRFCHDATTGAADPPRDA